MKLLTVLGDFFVVKIGFVEKNDMFRQYFSLFPLLQASRLNRFPPRTYLMVARSKMNSGRLFLCGVILLAVFLQLFEGVVESLLQIPSNFATFL